MALAPARLLLPVRAVDPAHPSSLSSASVCSAAGAYPHFSLFFLHPSTHRSTSPVCARVSEAPSFRNNRHSQFRKDANETAPFDDLHSLYEEERGRSSYPNRNPNGRTYSTQRSGRGGGNSGRSTWEPSNYVPWRSRGVSDSDANSRYDKPWSSQGRFSSSFSQSQDTPAGRSQQTMNGKFDMGFARRGGAYNERGNSPWEGQGSFSRRGSSGAYNESRNSPRKKQGSFAGRGNFSREDEQRVRRSPPWEDKDRESSLAENWSSTNGRSQRQYNGGVVREERSSQLSSHSRDSSSWQSLKWRGDVAEQASLPGIGLEKKPRIAQSAKNSWSSAPRDYPVAPWQSSFSKEWETKEKAGNEEEEKGGYGYTEANAGLKGEQDQNSSPRTDVSPIARIMERLRSIDDMAFAHGTREGDRHSRGGLADYLTLPSAKEYLSDRRMPEPSTEELPKGELDTRFPWEIEEATIEEDRTVERARRLRPLSAAELTIPASELKRLRILSVHLKQRVKLGKHGVTTDLVKSIMQRFSTCEVVKVKCEGPPAGNMKKTLETLEQRTRGLVIWKAGSVAVLYRGKDFGQPVAEIVDDLLAKKLERLMSTDGEEATSSAGLSVGGGALQDNDTEESDKVDLIPDDDSKQTSSGVSQVDATKRAPPQKTRKLGPEFEKIEEYAMEVEDILRDLGPRYEEWIGPKPVPVDGDLLPSVIPDFRPPYRLLPFGVKPNISNTVATHLRRLSQPLAPHFVIGRDRGLQGLASAMVKLWEKSEIAKIGIKRGILNTNQERIVEDLKQLTGGFFLCRDKKSMTFYRGKDFLPQAVSAALAERQDMVQTLQDEETGRLDRSLKVHQSMENSDVKPSWVQSLDPVEQIRLKREAVKARRLQIVNHIERKLKMALRKKEKAGRELEKVEEHMKPVGSPNDKETVTDEERFMLRKLGLKMKAFLLVGRRGVFSGVVQNMHLHWKHRELVKIVVKEKNPVHLKEMASMLECESGGLLISIDPTSKGYAIVYYRGKNYTRPPQLRPPNLLTKRLALKRSVEIQRRLSLSKHIQALEEEIVHLRAGLSKLSQYSSESSEHQVLNEDVADVQGSLKLDGECDNQPSHIQSSVFHNGLLEKQEEVAAIFAEEGFDFSSEGEGEMLISQISKQKLIRLCEMGPIFRAVRLSKTERHAFRNEVFKLSKAAQYMVGKSNPLSTIAKAIRLYFLDHAFIKIGVRNRPLGTSVQDIAEGLEDLTGGTVYAQDDYQIVLYRGWPTGENMPLGELYDVISAEQCDVLEADDEADDDGDDESENILKNGLIIDSTFVEYTENASGEESNEDVDGTDEDDVIKEGADGMMLADTTVKNTNYVSDEDEDHDLQWDRLSDGNTEDDNDEEQDDDDDDDDDDDLRWVGWSNGDVDEAEKTGDDEVDNFSDKHSENFSFVENGDGVDIEGTLRWDSLVLGENDGGVAGGISFNFDLDEDV